MLELFRINKNFNEVFLEIENNNNHKKATLRSVKKLINHEVKDEEDYS